MNRDAKSGGGMAPVGAGHEEWYKREVERGRRFHGAFAGGFSAGYHNSVGSAGGWQPSSYYSSRDARQVVTRRTAADYADEEDGLIGASLEISRSYVDKKRNNTKGDDLSLLLHFDDRLESTRAQQMLRLLSRQKLKAGEKVQFTAMPRIAIKADRFCLGYSSFFVKSTPSTGQGMSRQKTGGLELRAGMGWDDEDDTAFFMNDEDPHQRMYFLENKIDDADRKNAQEVYASSAPLFLAAAPEDTRRLRTGEPLPGFVRAVNTEQFTFTYSELPSPPRDWQRRHVFHDDDLQSHSQKPYSASVWRRPAHQVARGFQDQSKSLAVNDRFRSAKDESHDKQYETAPRTHLLDRPGLHLSSEISAQKESPHKAHSQPHKKTPETWHRKPIRTSTSWRPLPLLCKRFGLPVPVVQEPTPDKTTPSRLDHAVNTYRQLETGSAAKEEEEGIQIVEPPDRPEIDIFKAIFDQVQDVEEQNETSNTFTSIQDHPVLPQSETPNSFDDIFTTQGQSQQSARADEKELLYTENSIPPQREERLHLRDTTKRRSHNDHDDQSGDDDRGYHSSKKKKKKHSRDDQYDDRQKRRRRRRASASPTSRYSSASLAIANEDGEEDRYRPHKHHRQRRRRRRY